MPAIRSHHTDTSDARWDGPANEGRLDNSGTPDYYRSAFAWQIESGAVNKGDYRFIHHEVAEDGTVGAASIRACLAGIGVLNGARGGTTIPDADREGVYRHLATHITDSGGTPPELKSMKTKQTKTLDIGLELKQLSDDGTFDGDLSVYDFVDYGGDCVQKGAFTKTLKENGGVIPLLAHHNAQTFNIGALTLTDGDTALAVKGTLNLDLADGKAAHSAMRFNKANGIKTGLSMGFMTVRDEVKDGIRFLKEVKLFEGSIVNFPMNRMCTVAQVKAGLPIEEAKAFADELEQIQALELKWQLMNALWSSLDDLLYDPEEGQTPDAIASACAGEIASFSAAWVAFVPRWLAAREAQMAAWGYMGREVPEEKQFPVFNAKVKAATLNLVNRLLAPFVKSRDTSPEAAAAIEASAAVAEPAPVDDHLELKMQIAQLTKEIVHGSEIAQ